MKNHSLNLKDPSFLVWNIITIKQRLARTAKPPLLLNHLRQIIEIKSNSDIQDRALILFSWISATRRSEIVAVRCTKPTSKLFLCAATDLQPRPFLLEWFNSFCVVLEGESYRKNFMPLIEKTEKLKKTVK